MTIVMKLCRAMAELFHRTPYWIPSGRVEKCSGQCVYRVEPPGKHNKPLWKDFEGFSLCLMWYGMG